MDCRDMIVSEDYMGILLDYLPGEQERSGDWYCYKQIDGALGVYYMEIARAMPLSPANYLYRYIPQLYGLGGFPAMGSREFDAGPLEVSGILAQQQPPLELTGRSVVMAFLDTGISYENPVFRFSDGSSRILAIWDQTDQSGTAPEGIGYGSEYTRKKINEALFSEDPFSVVPERDENGHGTAMASVAAGSRLEEGTAFTGAAPDADIVVVKLRPAKRYLREFYQVAEEVPAYSADDIMFAVKYVQQFAVPLYRPLVICLGTGTSLGSHTGGSLLSEYLQSIAARISHAVVIGGGNEGNTAGHFRAALKEEETKAEIRVGENVRGFTAELWGTLPAVFRISVRSPGGELIPETDFRLGASVDYTFVYEKTRVRIDYMTNERNTGNELILLRFTLPSPGVWTISVRGLRSLFGEHIRSVAFAEAVSGWRGVVSCPGSGRHAYDAVLCGRCGDGHLV